jgi:hypothetical protein
MGHRPPSCCWNARGHAPCGACAFFAFTQDLRPGLNCVAPPELGQGGWRTQAVCWLVGRFDWTESPRGSFGVLLEVRSDSIAVPFA